MLFITARLTPERNKNYKRETHLLPSNQEGHKLPDVHRLPDEEAHQLSEEDGHQSLEEEGHQLPDQLEERQPDEGFGSEEGKNEAGNSSYHELLDESDFNWQQPFLSVHKLSQTDVDMYQKEPSTPSYHEPPASPLYHSTPKRRTTSRIRCAPVRLTY